MKIGLLGGTFDPPHYGHLIMAEEAREQAGLDEVWFLPTYLPPHKKRQVTEAEHRIEMVNRAIRENPYFKLNVIEHERKGRSYTIDTILALKAIHPEHDFFFVVGGDMVEDLPNWYRIDELKTLISFIGISRTGFHHEWHKGFNVVEIDMPAIDLSSTLIRERLRSKRSCRYFLPDSVRSYIEETGLYE